MISGVNYFTPTELFTRAPLGAISRAEIPGPQFKGKIGTVTRAGASTGSIQVGGYVIDAYQTLLRVKTGGDLGVAELEISTNNGVDFEDAVLMDANAFAEQPTASRWTYEINVTGVTLVAANGSGTPNSFIAGDTWSFTSTASPKLVNDCKALSAYFRKWGENTGQPITDIDDADRDMLCWWWRWAVTSGRGQVPEDWKQMADIAKQHFRLESLGDLQLNSEPDPDAFLFPYIERARPAFRFTTGGPCDRRVWRH